MTRLHAKRDVSGGQDVLACGEVACFTQEAVEVAAGRRGGQNGLGPRNGRLKREARWYATK